jgi:hypothetical protein
VKEIKSVRAIVHKIDPVFDRSKTEQRTCSGRWSSGVVNKLDCNLFTGRWIHFNEIPVISVGRYKIVMRRQHKTEWIVQRFALGHCETILRSLTPEKRIRNRRNPIVETVRDIQNSGLIIKRNTSRPYH